MAIRFDPDSRRPVDDVAGEYLECESHYFEDPLFHYWVRRRDGEALSSADAAERRLDTTGDREVDRIEAVVFRIFARRHDGRMVRVWSRWHPAARRFTAFYKTLLLNQQAIPPTTIAISFRLWSELPHNER